MFLLVVLEAEMLRLHVGLLVTLFTYPPPLKRILFNYNLFVNGKSETIVKSAFEITPSTSN